MKGGFASSRRSLLIHTYSVHFSQNVYCRQRADKGNFAHLRPKAPQADAWLEPVASARCFWLFLGYMKGHFAQRRMQIRKSHQHLQKI